MMTPAAYYYTIISLLEAYCGTHSFGQSRTVESLREALAGEPDMLAIVNLPEVLLTEIHAKAQARVAEALLANPMELDANPRALRKLRDQVYLEALSDLEAPPAL